MTHQIVFIGGSYGALPPAHTLLTSVLPKLTSTTSQTYKITLISSSSDFYWKVGSPRTIVNPSALPISKVLLPIAPEFAKYSAEQFEFIHAFAEKLDPVAKVIALSTGMNVHYDTLIIASGTSFISPIWSVANGSDATRTALEAIHARLPTAKSVLVAGGGAAGVETAGELGALYGKSKQITLLSGSTQLLSKLNNAKTGRMAQQKLESMGVKVVNDALKVTSAEREGEATVLKFSNGSVQSVDVFIEATGDRPNSKFVPEAWLNAKGFVKTEGTTLRLAVEGVKGVYCIGSVGSYSDGSIFDTTFAKNALVESIRLDLLELGMWLSFLLTAPFYCRHVLTNVIAGKPENNKRKTYYNKVRKDMQFVPVGPNGGVGSMYNFSVPSFVIKMAKSKDFFIGNAVKTVNGTV